MHVRRLLALAITLAVVAGLTLVVGLVRRHASKPHLTTRPARGADGRCRGVALALGADVQRAIDANRVGTVFCLAAGTYRVGRPIEPKAAMQLVGEGPGRTVLDGSEELKGWARLVASGAGVAGGIWSAPGRLPSRPAPDRHCLTAGCGIAQDVFFDGRRMERAMRIADLTPDRFYESFADNRVLLAADPTGHVVEQAVAPRVVSSRASSVRVADLSIGKAANAAQVGGLHAADGAAGWVLDNVEVFANHGTGAVVDGGTVRNSHFHHNGQLGLAGAGDGSHRGQRHPRQQHCGVQPRMGGGGREVRGAGDRHAGDREPGARQPGSRPVVRHLLLQLDGGPQHRRPQRRPRR